MVTENEIGENLWKDRPVLVTGGVGFIGSHLAHALLRLGARVTILDKKEEVPALGGLWDELRSRAYYHSGDVREGVLVGALLKKHRIQTIFHLAAEAIVGRAHESPEEALDTNVRGTWNVLEQCRLYAPHAEIVVASSDKAYGVHKNLPYREDFPLLGGNPYDCSKSAADRIAEMYAKTYGVKAVITRCGNVYGGGDLNFSRLIPDMIRSFFFHMRPEIRSDGLYRRDYVHVADIVRAYLKSAEALIGGKIAAGEAFNFGTETPRTALEVATRIGTLMEAGVPPAVLASARYEIRDQYLDSQKARSILKWSPCVDFDEGLAHTIRWYSEYFSHG